MEYKDFALSLSEKAGSIMKKHFSKVVTTWKADNSPVTQADLKVNALLVEEVRKNFPGHGVLGEESSFEGEGEYVWVCDPLDGTRVYSRGIPTSAFTLALTRNGKPILGAVNQPFSGSTFFAEKGKGAFLNSKKISVSKNKAVENAMVGMTCWTGAKYDFTEVYRNLTFRKACIIDLGSIANMDALVACGSVDATIFGSSKPWDTAAAKVIVEEAGGRVTDVFGKEQRYDCETNGHVVSNGFLHKQLLEIIAEEL